MALAILTLGAALAACGGPGSTGRASPSPRAPGTGSYSPSPSKATGLTAAWPTYHLNTRRTGASPDTPRPTSPEVAWQKVLDGSVYGEPLDVGGMVIVATENDSVYALDPGSGSVLWRTHVGTPVPQGDLPCGDIFPLGITGTPAFDPVSQTVFAVAEESGPVHVLYALDAATGAVRWSRRVDIQIASENPAAVQQRPALAVANGYVYIGFGGLDGDCAQYRGAVVAVPTTDSGPTLQYVVPTTREGAVWATGGPVVGPGGTVFVSTGNGAATANPWDHSDSVLELSPTLGLISAFAPSSWAFDNQHDLDLGSVAPTLLPDGEVFIAGKGGTGYVLRQTALGGVGGELASGPTCGGEMAFGGTSFYSDTVYLPCQNGVEAIAVASSGSFSVLWQTSTGANGPPVLGGGCVWSVDTDSGVLYALDRVTGATIERVAIGSVPHFSSPTLVGSRAFVGTDQGVTAVFGV